MKSKRMKLIKAIKSQFSSMTVSFGFSPNVIKTAFEYLIRIKKIYKDSLVFSIITLIFLLPSLIYGRFFRRQSLVNQIKGNPRELCLVSLRDIENKYLSKYGKLNLSKIKPGSGGMSPLRPLGAVGRYVCMGILCYCAAAAE